MMQTDEISLPAGWERKFDATSGRNYYVDHSHRVTQWEDPRLKDPSIWREPQNQFLEGLKIIFPGTTEEILRQALIKRHFVQAEAINDLRNLGHKATGSAVTSQIPVLTASTVAKSLTDKTDASKNFPNVTSADVTERRRSSPKPRSAAASIRATGGADSGGRADQFTLMTLKSRFAETADDVLVDVLNQCGGNIDLSTRELTNMGYAGRQRAIERSVERDIKADDKAKEKQKKHQEDREQTLGQLKKEFEAFLDKDIAEAFEKCSFDVFETRSKLRQREADVRLQSLTDALKISQTPTKAVQIVTVKETPTEAIITNTIATDNRGESSKRGGIKTEGSALVLVKPPSKSESKQKTHKKRKEIFNVEQILSKSAGATPSRQIVIGRHLSLAKGPNPDLRRGSDSNLRCGISRAIGPDPTLRKGPNPLFRNMPIIKNETVIITAVQ